MVEVSAATGTALPSGRSPHGGGQRHVPVLESRSSYELSGTLARVLNLRIEPEWLRTPIEQFLPSL